MQRPLCSAVELVKLTKINSFFFIEIQRKSRKRYPIGAEIEFLPIPYKGV